VKLKAVNGAIFLGRSIVMAGDEIQSGALALKLHDTLIRRGLISEKDEGEFCCEGNIALLQLPFYRRGERYTMKEMEKRATDLCVRAGRLVIVKPKGTRKPKGPPEDKAIKAAPENKSDNG